ncbi:MAG: hypothetical protein JWR21_3700 [Herminiimonas sp.]|nr:hypothetical protein [Herminiimonas sp.]
MQILLIEDSDGKRQSIQSLVEKEYPSARLIHAHSVRSAIDTISDSPLDLIIADMSLPTYDIEVRERGGTPRPFGGIEIFEHMERLGLEVPILVVTSYPTIIDGNQSVSFASLSKQLKLDFQKSFLGMVYFDSAYTSWERDITSALKQLFESKSCP